jgi:hypothetical protein
VVAIADPAIRARLASSLTARGRIAAVIIHPAALIRPDTSVGDGCIVLANTYISSPCVHGNHVQVNYNATVGHDAQLGTTRPCYPVPTFRGACAWTTGRRLAQMPASYRGVGWAGGRWLGPAPW